MLHCCKPEAPHQTEAQASMPTLQESVFAFLSYTDIALPTIVYLHVGRQEEVDYRKLYSDWLSQSLMEDAELMDFAQFRVIVKSWLEQKRNGNSARINQG